MPQWELPLIDFVANKTNYSLPSNDRCISCQDYTEIDNFAKSVTLDKLQQLKNLGVGHTLENDPQKFDATVMLETLKDASGPTLQDEQIFPGIKVALRNQFEKIPADPSLMDLFAVYANWPIKNAQDLQDYDAQAKKEIADLETAAQTAATPQLQAGEHAKLAMKKNELKEWTVISRWLYLAGRLPLVLGVAQGLYTQLVKKKVAAQYATDADDCVLKARLMYVWVAHSITYDYILANKVKNSEKRAAPDMFATGKEVCVGYADLFAQMFNAVARDNGPHARAIGGFTRGDGGDQKQTDLSKTKDGHAWAVFPFWNPATEDSHYKVIDPTWAKPNGAKTLTPAWWSSTNASYSHSHIPEKSLGDFCLPKTALPTSKTWLQDAWEASQPWYFSNSLIHWIDKDTLTQPESSISVKAADGTASISFRNNCKHQADKMPKFYLSYTKTNATIDKFKISKDKSADFTAGAVNIDGRKIWNAKLIGIPKSQPGFISIHTSEGGIGGIAQTHTAIITWAVKWI